MTRWFWLLLILVTAPTIAVAETFRFDDIVVDGRQRVDPNAIAGAIKVKEGTDVTLEDINADVLRLYAMKDFSDIRTEIVSEEGTTKLYFRLKERPLVRLVETKGNVELTEDKLRDLLRVKKGRLLEHRDLIESIGAIKALYVQEGFHGAEVEEEVEVNDYNEATVTFLIEEGEKILIDTITFEGNEVFSEGELRKLMMTKQRWVWSWLTDRGAFNDEMLQNDVEILRDHYMNNGYAQIDIKTPVVTIAKSSRPPYYCPHRDDRRNARLAKLHGPGKDYLYVHIEISEGEKFSYGSVGVAGDLLYPEEELLGKLAIHPGRIFSRKELRESMQTLNDLYADQGYAFVNVVPQTRIDPVGKLVNVTFVIEKGELVHIGRINISGNTKSRDKVIRREMKLAEGELYSSSKLRQSRRMVYNLGFFEEVNIENRVLKDKSLMDLDISVKERPTGTFSLGFGYSSIDKFFGQMQISQENFLGRGLKLQLSGSHGGTATTYQVGLLDPYFLDTKLSLGFDIYKSTRDWTDYSKDTTGFDIKAGYPISDELKTFFIYRYEEKDIYDVDVDATNTIQELAGKSILSSIYGSISRDTTDVRFDPTSGNVTKLSAEYAGLGGDEKFAKYILDHRYYHPLFWKFVFLAHGQLGLIQEVGGEATPVDERFYLGGINTIRGLPSREVGPQENGDFIGGHKAAFGNLEIAWPLIEEAKVKGVLFFDGGNAWSQNQDYFSTDLRYGYGFGIRWFSPIGPLRLEWGYNLDPKGDEPEKQFEFSIGVF